MYSAVPTSQESAVESAIERGPSLWAVTSHDQINEFGATCVFDGDSIGLSNTYVLGITPHDASMPQCQADSYSF